jgi:hypothetical protein
MTVQAQANTFTTLNGNFKQVYAEKLKDLIPDGVKALNRIKFSTKEKLGNAYNQPVILGMEHGVTFAGSDDDAFALNDAVPGVIKNATIAGHPLVLRSILGYAAASRAVAGGEAAFVDSTKYIVSNMMRSMSKKLEIEMFYGQMGYGTVASLDSGAGTAVQTVTITTAEWAPGIWAGAEKMPVDVYQGATSTPRALAGSITSVNLETRVLVITYAGNQTLVAGDTIYHAGAYGKEFAGIHKIITNTGSLFGIDAGAYNLWKGNTFAAGSAALSFTKMNLAAARAVEKGLDGKLVAFVNPRAWSNMLSDQAALRKYDQSYSTSKLENGSQSLQFFSQNGEIEIVPSVYVKEGYAYLVSVDEWSRIGSTDLTFKRPGYGENFFRELESNAGYELRAYTDQALFCAAPGRNTMISGIVNAV